MNYLIKEANWKTDSKVLQSIREKVFIEEQNVSHADEWDNKDNTAIHFLVALETGKAIACARVLQENNIFHIGRVAVLVEYRHQKIGRQIMQFILSWCKTKNSDYGIYLHAQTSRIEFYHYLGFVAKGDVFMDAGIEHVEMWYKP